MLLQEALNTEHERSAKESSEAVQRSLAMQKAQSEAEIGVMKNRLEHEKVSAHCPWSHSFSYTLTLAYSVQCPEKSNHQPVQTPSSLNGERLSAQRKVAMQPESMPCNTNVQAMSEQRQEATAAMIDSLHAELAERGAIIAHLQEELQQKEHLLQQISMAAAPVPPTALAVAPSPKRPTPGKGARLPRHTPQRVMDGPKPALHPQKPALASLHSSPMLRSSPSCPVCT